VSMGCASNGSVSSRTRGDSDRELCEQPDFNLSIEYLSTFEFECDAAEFEVLLSLDYILQADYMRRSLSWSCAYLHARIETHRRLDSATNIGAEFANAWQREGHGERVNYDSVEGVGRLESVLARDEFRPVEAEYQRLRRKKNRRPEWFQLFDGANNRRKLAKAVHQETDYMALYSGWSGFSHAADASPYLRPGREPHESAFLAVRSAHNMQHQANFAVGWMVHCTRIVLAHFRPNENLGEWYRRDVKPLADSLRALRVVITEHDAE
jgi:hypothetical protein